MTEYIVYVLKSLNSDHYYVGQTINLKRRIQEHNSRKVFWTKRYAPWIIIYTEKYTTREEAVKREKYFKSHAGRNWLKSSACSLIG